jgi:hypothetical protein
MNVDNLANKKQTKSASPEKINNDRISISQQIGWLFRPLALCPFPAQCLGKRKVTDMDGNEDEEYHILWRRKSGNITVEVLAHPKHGVPFGQDTLIILFLANEARKQGSRKIKVNFYRDFMRMFGMNANSGSKYRLVIESLRRIRHSQYSWEVEGEPSREKGLHYMYIDEYDLYCDPKKPDQKLLFDQYILLSERFWYEIVNHKIPFNIDAVLHLKSKPAYLNFYIWLSTRIGMLNAERKDKELEKIDIHVPFWGENGITQQLSTRMKRRPDFRKWIKNWLDKTKELWPLCPVTIDGDALHFEVSSDTQMDVQIDPRIEIGKAARKAINDSKKDSIPCPVCNTLMELREGKKTNRGQFSNYYRCKNCKKNYPEKNLSSKG